MKKLLIAILLLATGAALGWGVAFWNQHWGEVSVDSGREVLHYRNPMDSSITSDAPKKDSMGMNYIPVYAGGNGGGADDGGGLRLNPAVLHNLNVRLADVEQGDLVREVRTVGFVTDDESRLHHVHLRTQGWIEELAVRTTGERVERGQVLFRLYSPALVNAQEELLQALRRGGNGAPARERLMALGMAEADVRSLEGRGEVSQLVPVRARHGGIVRELNVREGMQMSPASAVMSISDLSRVWVMADVFERQLPGVNQGNTARVILAFLPGEPLQGTVDFIYPTLETATRSNRVRLVFDNPDGRLKPGMVADVALAVEPLMAVVHVPAESVIRTGRLSRVVVAMGGGRFEGREVRVGQRAGDRLQILQGLEPGERVVASGHFLIDSESAVGASLRRLEAAGPEHAEHAAQGGDGKPEIWSEARVKTVDTGAREITLDHAPIPELEWPRMTMGFSVDGAVDLEAVKSGMGIRFRMVQGGPLGYEVRAIVPLDGEPAHD